MPGGIVQDQAAVRCFTPLAARNSSHPVKMRERSIGATISNARPGAALALVCMVTARSSPSAR